MQIPSESKKKSYSDWKINPELFLSGNNKTAFLLTFFCQVTGHIIVVFFLTWIEDSYEASSVDSLMEHRKQSLHVSFPVSLVFPKEETNLRAHVGAPVLSFDFVVWKQKQKAITTCSKTK